MLTWTPTDVSLPDDDMTVLVALDDGEVWPAFLDGETWRYVTDDPIEDARVLFWMHIPAHPMEQSEAA